MSTPEWNAKLEEQLLAIEAACQEFDRGQKQAAMRIASPLRAIFHDSAMSTSLVRNLHASGLHLLTTCAKKPADLAHWSGLIRMDLDAQNSVFRAFPKLGTVKREHRSVPASYWWETEVILTHGQQKRTKRGGLVLAAADRAAGLATSEKSSASYHWLTDGSGWPMDLKTATTPGRVVAVYDAHLAALRQLAFEVLHSPGLLALAGRLETATKLVVE